MISKWLAFVMLALWLPAVTAAQVALRVDGDDGLRGRPMMLDGVFVGVVGDTISVSGRAQRLDTEIAPGIRATQQITFPDGVLRMTPVPGSQCMGNSEWGVSDWRAPALERRGLLTIAHLTKPTPQLVGTCAEDLLPNMPCYPVLSKVGVVAQPEVNADIWLDGRPIGAATSAVLELRHCQGFVRTLGVVLRKPGFANCLTVIVLGGQEPAGTVGCALKKF